MPGPIPLSFDVTEALGADATDGQKIVISGWLFFPDDIALLGKRPVTMTLLAGGSYDKRYHHVEIPGHPGYSAAEHLAALGNIVLLTDHLGVGESSKLPQQSKATRKVAALANHTAVEQFHARLAKGDLHPALPAFADVVRFGGGHSMGGMQTIMQQAHFRSYAGVMILAFTAEGVHFDIDGKKVPVADSLPTQPGADYNSGDRAGQHYMFHWEDVPADVIAFDDTLNVDTPAGIGLDSVRMHIVKEEASWIETPVYICFGERDTSPDVRAEPTLYSSSNDITLHVLPRSGHCQTFASTRHQMWNRMHNWTHYVADTQGDK